MPETPNEGWCTPVPPLYDWATQRVPMEDDLGTTSVPRGPITFSVPRGPVTEYEAAVMRLEAVAGQPDMIRLLRASEHRAAARSIRPLDAVNSITQDISRGWHVTDNGGTLVTVAGRGAGHLPPNIDGAHAAQVLAGEWPPFLRTLLYPGGWPHSWDRVVAPRLSAVQDFWRGLPDEIIGRIVTALDHALDTVEDWRDRLSRR